MPHQVTDHGLRALAELERGAMPALELIWFSPLGLGLALELGLALGLAFGLGLGFGLDENQISWLGRT